MKKSILLLAAACGLSLSLSAAESSVVKKAAPAVPAAKDVAAPADQYWPIMISVMPSLPSVAYTCNVYGLKHGAVASGGVGRVYGLEISWLMAGTADIKGIQGCWTYCQNDRFDGIQSSFLTVLNFEEYRGLQATLGYAQAGNFQGAQGAFVSVAKDYQGLQAGLAVSVAQVATGFQASAVSVANQELNGVQCGILNQAEACNGVQLGLLNFSNGGKGMQFGLSNYIEGALVPWLPILNFKF